MTDPARPRSTVSTHGTVTLRPPPGVLLMIARVRAAEATLDIGLGEVRRRADDAARRLVRLGAARTWVGPPHPDDQADPDPVAGQMRAVAARRRPAATGPADRPGVNIAGAATWDIAGLPAERVLALVDRLRFDAAADADPPDPSAGPPPWADPVEQIQQLMARAAEPADDRSPWFVYLARATDGQLAAAVADAYRSARHRAERLAGAAGQRVCGVSSLTYGQPAAGGRPDQLMAQQRCAALLAAVGYELGDGEVAAEDPRAAEVAVSVHATHYLDG